MKKKTEKVCFNDLWGQMVERLGNFIETGDQEQLHQFRLQVKKLRALLALIDACLPKSTLSKEFKPVKKIFAHCGIIREAYVNLLLSTKYKLENEDFIKQQVSDMERQISILRDNQKRYLRTIKLVHRDIEDELAAINDDRINEYYKDQLEQIAIILARHQFDEGLHDCRKKIKILMYNRKIAANALEGNLTLNTAYLDKLQDQLGNWHDAVVAIGLFSAPEINAKPVVARIKRQNTKLRKSINELSDDFWKKATLADAASNNGGEAKVWV